MTVKELKDCLHQLDSFYDNDQIVISIHGLGDSPCSPCEFVSGASLGVDWDHGKVFLHPERSLIRGDFSRDKPRRSILVHDKDGCKRLCTTCNSRVLDTMSFCPHCGQRLKHR